MKCISIDEDKQQLKSAYIEKKKQTTRTKVIQEINKRPKVMPRAITDFYYLQLLTIKANHSHCSLLQTFKANHSHGNNSNTKWNNNTA